jgi:predicted glycosyltransferase involved in capsule biosynthesis
MGGNQNWVPNSITFWTKISSSLKYTFVGLIYNDIELYMRLILLMEQFRTSYEVVDERDWMFIKYSFPPYS